MSLKNVLWLFMLLSFALFLFNGCSSDEENPITPAPRSDPPEFNLQDVSFPDKMQNSTDEKAKLAISLVNEAMSFEGTGCVFGPPSGATVNSETQTAWEYSWEDGGLTKRLAITLLSGQRKWQQFFTGSADGIAYDNWRSMDAAQKTDLTIGHVYLYKANTGQIAEEWSWHTLENNKYVFKKQKYVDPVSKIQITFEENNAGNIESYKPGSTGSLVYDVLITWDAAGNGSWRTFQDGTPLDNGTWN